MKKLWNYLGPTNLHRIGVLVGIIVIIEYLCYVIFFS